MRLDSQSKDAADAVHRLVLPTHRARSVRVIVPVARARRVQTGAVLLHYHTSHDIFVRLLLLGKYAKAILDHRSRPVVDFVMLVCIAADGLLDCLLDDVGHLVDDELVFFSVIHAVAAWCFQWAERSWRIVKFNELLNSTEGIFVETF